MAFEARQLSWWDTLRLQLNLTMPTIVLGLVAPIRLLFSPIARRRGAGEGTMRFLRELRRKYGDHAWTWFPLRRTLLVFAPATVEAVLASDANAADPTIKRRALSRFVPGALVISSGDAWRKRRAFNEAALDLDRLHRHSDTFSSIAIAEARRLSDPPRTMLRWRDFQSLARRISHQVVLGVGNVDVELADHLARMLPWSNVLLRHPWAFHRFYKGLGRYLARARPRAASACLLEEQMWLESQRAGSSVRVPAQIGFWFFVLKDALELHVARTLALVAAHPVAQAKLRQEIRDAGALTATAIDGLKYLESCILEQLRLWTPVPLLLRRALQPMSIGERIAVAPGEQILFAAGFHHRDGDAFGDFANRFSPDAAGSPGYPPNYAFSAHRQRCAGRSLVLFLLKATLASLLSRSAFELAGPRVDTARIGYLYDHFGIGLRPVAPADLSRLRG